MSNTHKHERARRGRQADEKRNPQPDFDGRRYGNKRKAVAKLKVKDRRRRKRAGRQAMLDFEPPKGAMRKHVMD